MPIDEHFGHEKFTFDALQLCRETKCLLVAICTAVVLVDVLVHDLL